ncbi:unnamed protein product [Ectocarpus fasciculatus]
MDEQRGDEPSLLPAKRVRWDDSVLPHRTNTPGTATATATCSSNKAPPVPPSCSANDAIRLCSAIGRKTAGAEEKEGVDVDEGCRPDFTHQLFDEERIEGFEDGGVSIRIFYTPTSLDFLVKIQTSENDASRTTAVLSGLSKALPPENFTTDELKFYEELEGRRRDFKPPGARVYEYSREGTTFSVYKATGEDLGACEYHARAQCLAPWFIETADAIDLTDDRWEVFYLFQEEPPQGVLGEKWRPAALAGYFTAFGFRNPVKGVSLRICQALVLPQFQRQGHGKALLSFLYGLARSRKSVFEITVEDPAPGFEKVRNLVDARTLRDLDVFPADVISPDAWKRPSKDVVQAAREAAKLTVSQVEIGFDILKACHLPEVKDYAREDSMCPMATATASSTTTAADAAPTATAALSHRNTAAASAAPGDGSENATAVDDKRKSYRLMVKRRLLKRHGEELSTDSATRKRQLDELYRDVEPGLLSLGAKLRKEGRREAAAAIRS